MAWNDPGNGKKNPWDQGGQSTPDLDAVVKDLQRKLGGLFGGRGSPGSGKSSSLGVGFVVALLLVGWFLLGLYKLDAAERGIVLQFGAYRETTQPGLHWLPWPIQTVEKVNTFQPQSYSQQTRMLTEDENIVVVDMVVQYRRSDPRAYLFNVRSPEATVSEVSDSAIREVVGKSELDFVLTEGRTEIAARTKDLIQRTLNAYNTGIEVYQVNLQDAQFPDQVQAAALDAIKAREDKDRQELEAEAYSNDILPRARGAAARETRDAEAYRDRVIADAEGESSRFSQVLTEYEKAPDVTRERLYLETIEQVFASTSKVLLDAEGSGNMIYLPIDRLMEQQNEARRDRLRRSEASGANSLQDAAANNRESRRNRGDR